MDRIARQLAITAALIGCCLSGAQAELFPSRPITIVVPFPPAGPSDVLGRILGSGMQAALGQSVIIENVTGAAGSIGVGRVAHAKPDGYTLILGNLGTHVFNGAIYKLGYDVLGDFQPISLLPTNHQLLLVSNTTPASSVAELIAWLKAHPDKMTAGTAGPGSPSHLSAAYFQIRTGTRFQLIPYRGTPQAMQDLVAGRIDILFDQSSGALPLVRAGKVKALAVTADHRLAVAPDIATVDEAGLPAFYTSQWFGLWAPKGTPNDVVATLDRAVTAALADRTVRSRLSDLGAAIPDPQQQTPDALAALQKAEIEKWWPVIKKTASSEGDH